MVMSATTPSEASLKIWQFPFDGWLQILFYDLWVYHLKKHTHNKTMSDMQTNDESINQ